MPCAGMRTSWGSPACHPHSTCAAPCSCTHPLWEDRPQSHLPQGPRSNRDSAQTAGRTSPRARPFPSSRFGWDLEPGWKGEQGPPPLSILFSMSCTERRRRVAGFGHLSSEGQVDQEEDGLSIYCVSWFSEEPQNRSVIAPI